MSNKLTLRDELFIGKGGHQTTFIHPEDPSKCVKIPHDPNDRDIQKEQHYRKICAKKLENSKLVTKFFGTVETNLGTGYVFERVTDYNGQTSKDLQKFLSVENPDAETLRIIRKLLLDCKKDFINEGVVTVDTNIVNFMAQEISPGNYQAKIVDNLGTPVLIPLVYYSNFVASYKAKKVWGRLAKELAKSYPEIVTPEFYEKLKT